MMIKGIVWGGTKTQAYQETAAFFESFFGMAAVSSQDDLSVFRLPNGDLFEVIGPSMAPELNDAAKFDFLVDDVKQAREEMEAMGISFIGPVYSSPDQNWTNFLAPDGNVYGLTDLMDHPSHTSGS